MNYKIQSIKGRLSLMLVVLISAILSFLTLLITGKIREIQSEAIMQAIKVLIEIYLPLITMMAAFYFGQNIPRSEKNQTSIEIFIFAIITVGIWVVSPIVLFILGGTIDNIIGIISLLKPYGETVAVAGVAYYFAKSGNKTFLKNK